MTLLFGIIMYFEQRKKSAFLCFYLKFAIKVLGENVFFSTHSHVRKLLTSTHVSISVYWFIMGRIVSILLYSTRSDLFPTNIRGSLKTTTKKKVKSFKNRGIERPILLLHQKPLYYFHDVIKYHCQPVGKNRWQQFWVTNLRYI